MWWKQTSFVLYLKLFLLFLPMWVFESETERVRERDLERERVRERDGFPLLWAETELLWFWFFLSSFSLSSLSLSLFLVRKNPQHFPVTKAKKSCTLHTSFFCFYHSQSIGCKKCLFLPIIMQPRNAKGKEPNTLIDDNKYVFVAQSFLIVSSQHLKFEKSPLIWSNDPFYYFSFQLRNQTRYY